MFTLEANVQQTPEFQRKKQLLNQIRTSLRNDVYTVYQQKPSSEELIEASYSKWSENPNAISGLMDSASKIQTRLHYSQLYLENDAFTQRELWESSISPEKFIRVSTGNELMNMLEMYIAHSSAEEGTWEPKLHETDHVSFELGGGLNSFLYDHGVTLNSVGVVNGVGYFAYDEYSSEVTEKAINILEASDYLPDVSYLKAAIFLPGLPISGVYSPAYEALMVGDGVKHGNFLRGDLDIKNLGLTMSWFAHERRHAEQPDLLGLYAEIDAFNEQHRYSSRVSSLVTNGTFDAIFPRSYAFRAYDSNSGLSSARTLLSRVASSSRKRQLTIDHNIAVMAALTDYYSSK